MDKEESLQHADRLAVHLLTLIMENKSNRKMADSWLKASTTEIDRMIRIDGRTPEEIEAVIDWCQADCVPRGNGGFCWAFNILSGLKLRMQFDRLQDNMQAQERLVTETGAASLAWRRATWAIGKYGTGYNIGLDFEDNVTHNVIRHFGDWPKFAAEYNDKTSTFAHSNDRARMRAEFCRIYCGYATMGLQLPAVLFVGNPKNVKKVEG